MGHACVAALALCSISTHISLYCLLPSTDAFLQLVSARWLSSRMTPASSLYAGATRMNTPRALAAYDAVAVRVYSGHRVAHRVIVNA